MNYQLPLDANDPTFETFQRYLNYLHSVQDDDNPTYFTQLAATRCPIACFLRWLGHQDPFAGISLVGCNCEKRGTRHANWSLSPPTGFLVNLLYHPWIERFVAKFDHANFSMRGRGSVDEVIDLARELDAEMRRELETILQDK